MNTADLVIKTKALQELFGRIGGEYDVRDYALDLTEELGELSQAILIVEERKTTNDPSKQKTIVDVADGLSDMLYDMIGIAKHYNIDLFKDYERMLVEVNERVKSGEFDGKNITNE